MSTPKHIEIYDTTLRDGAQAEDVSFSAEDKVRVAQKLDGLGAHFIEGGWPGANPRDIDFFRMIKTVPLKQAKVVAFGSTRRATNAVHHDPVLKSLLDAHTRYVTLFGKSWTLHVTDALGISLIRPEGAGCCGALAHHLSDHDASMGQARTMIDAWWPSIEAGAEAIVITASGCGAMFKDYGFLLRNDRAYAEKAARACALVRDVSEIVAAESGKLAGLIANRPRLEKARVAFQSPCTLQHGMKIRGVVEQILLGAGFDLTMVANGHLCCGSAGTYSILQPVLSKRLLANKVGALEADRPDVIATANIGCLLHVRSGTRIPVRHWIELVAERLG